MNVQIKPPFSLESAKEKVQRAEDLWNTKNPEAISKAYTSNSEWRNRNVFLKGRSEIKAFLKAKWEKERNYRLEKHLFSFSDEHIAVHFQYEYQDENSQWFRAYGNEHWTFDTEGLMAKRDASINDQAIDKNERIIF